MTNLRKKLEAGMQQAYDGYEESIVALARMAHQMVVVPFCKKHDLLFTAGMGTFNIYKEDHSFEMDDWCTDFDWEANEEAPDGWQEVLDVCYAEVPGDSGYPLGARMPDGEEQP